MDIKKIVVPTDFSDAANNALLYAAGLAKQFDAQIELVHAVLVPVLTARGKLFLPDQDVANANLKIAENQLEETKKMVSGKNGVQLDTNAILINWQMELAEAIHGKGADLIVLGTTGSSCLKKIFLGSNAARIIQNAPVPVLAVPANAKFSPLKKIGFAYDGLELKGFEKLSILNALKNKFKAGIDIFQIIQNKQTPSADLSGLVEFLPGAKTNEVYESVVESGILNRVKSKKLDMMTMIPRRRGFFHNLILGSITKRVAYKISVPLLAIPD
ncbi:MAG: universal stress protein [Bacteroidota bacterium]